MEQIERFFSKYPNIATLIIRLLATGLLLVAMAYFKTYVDNSNAAMRNSNAAMSVVVQNNTKALEAQRAATDRLTTVVSTVKEDVRGHEVLMREYDKRITKLER